MVFNRPLLWQVFDAASILIMVLATVAFSGLLVVIASLDWRFDLLMLLITWGFLLLNRKYAWV